jgi:hypothetical protein
MAFALIPACMLLLLLEGGARVSEVFVPPGPYRAVRLVTATSRSAVLLAALDARSAQDRRSPYVRPFAGAAPLPPPRLTSR